MTTTDTSKPHTKHAETFETFEARICDSLAPIGAFQEMLAARVCALAWRLRKSDALELGGTGMGNLSSRKFSSEEEGKVHRHLLETWQALRVAQGFP
jgi:hypothetical protein